MTERFESEPEARALLARLDPSLAEQPLRRSALGAEKIVWQVGDAHVLRVARNGEVAARMAGERRILEAIAGRLLLPTPSPVAVSEDEGADLCRKAPGEPLDWEAFAALGDAARDRLPDRFGRFVASLHRAIEACEARARGIPELRFAPNERPDVMESVLRAPLRGSAGEDLLSRVLALAPDLMAPVPEPVLLHDDLSHHNIGFDAEGTMRSVFDFAGGGLGDRHRDLRYAPGLGEGDDGAALAYEQASGIAISRRRQRAWHAFSALANLAYSLTSEPEALQTVRRAWVASVAAWPADWIGVEG